MIFAKILVLVFSVSAIPTKYESKTREPHSLDAKALTTGELVTQTRYKNQTIEKSSNTSSEIDQNGGIESYQNTFDRIGWRRRMTDWGDLDTLRALSIVQVRPPRILKPILPKMPSVSFANISRIATHIWNDFIMGRTTGFQSL